MGGQCGWGRPVKVDGRIAAARQIGSRHGIQPAVAFDRREQMEQAALRRFQAVNGLHGSHGHADGCCQVAQSTGKCAVGWRVGRQGHKCFSAKGARQALDLIPGVRRAPCVQQPVQPTAVAPSQTTEALTMRGHGRPGDAGACQRLTLWVALDHGGEAAERTIAVPVAGQEQQLVGRWVAFASIATRTTMPRIGAIAAAAQALENATAP